MFLQVEFYTKRHFYINKILHEKAVYWFEKAAEQKNAVAQNNLGYCYLKGLGVQKNKQKAIALLKKSAAQGYETTIESLAEF